MRGPEDHEIHWDGEYIEVERAREALFTVSDQPGEDVYDLCTVELTDLDGDAHRDAASAQSGGHMPAEAYRARRSRAGPASSSGSPSGSPPIS